MSYIEQAKQNAANAQKAAQLDQMQNMQRDQNSYNQGAMDLQRRLQQEIQDRLAQEAATREYDKFGNPYEEPTRSMTFSEFVRPATQELSKWWNDLKNRVSNYDFVQNESMTKQAQDSAAPMYNHQERTIYTDAYNAARQTPEGSPKALFGGKYAAKQAADAVKASRSNLKK